MAKYDEKACKRVTANIKTNAAGIENDIQDVALSIIEHIETKREASLACGLLNALGRSTRKKPLLTYLCTFGKLSENPDKAKGKTHPVVFDDDKSTDLEGGADQLWSEMKSAKVKVDYDFSKKGKVFLKALKKANGDGAVTDELLTAVRALFVEHGVSAD